ncbi:MAG: phage minor head protein [Pirellulaceae bacterium]
MLAAAGRRWQSQPPTSAQMQGDLATILGPERAARTAATETTQAQTAGGERGMAQTVGLSDLDTWFTRRDDRVCPTCEPLHQALRSEWQAQFPLGPPAHPQCRCWIRYQSPPREVLA